MPKTITLAELQANTGEIIDGARTNGEPVIVESDGKPVAAILSYDDYQAYRQYRQARMARFARLKTAVAEANGLSEVKALVLVAGISNVRVGGPARGEVAVHTGPRSAETG